MKMADLPEPLVPAEVDLTDFKYMPLEPERLRRSKAWLKAKRRPELGFYMMNLWAASWHERPAASLEDDDDALADAAMCDPKRWSKVKADVMRGWIKCSDGRLYHAVVAEKALEAWDIKKKNRKRTAAATKARKANINNDGPKRDDEDDGQRTGQRADERKEQHEPIVTSTKGREGKGIEGKGDSAQPPSLPAEPGPKTASPDDDPKALAVRANAVRVEVMAICGVDENRRPAWASYGAIVGWLQAGADPDLDILPTARTVAARLGDGNLRSPAGLTDAVLDALRSRKAAVLTGGEPAKPRESRQNGRDPQAGSHGFEHDTEAAQWRQRVTGLVERSFWLEERWGPQPGQRFCHVPKEILAEFADRLPKPVPSKPAAVA